MCCLSGGVDGLHMLMRNRQAYLPGEPAYIGEALSIHGFDIGKRARDPENERFQMALRRLQPLAAEAGVRIIPCRTNLRHLPTKPDFWTHRHNMAALAAVGHAAAKGSRFLFIAGAYHLANPVPMGSHPAVDGLFSSQHVMVVHEGARFSRVDKVRDLASWPTALSTLRVCAANVADKANCGVCEKMPRHPARNAGGGYRGDGGVWAQSDPGRAMGSGRPDTERTPRASVRGSVAILTGTRPYRSV